MNAPPNLQPALALDEAEHAPQRRTFIKRMGASLAALGSLALAGGQPAAQSRPASPARSTTAVGRQPADADNLYKGIWAVGQWQGNDFYGISPKQDGVRTPIVPKPAWQ